MSEADGDGKWGECSTNAGCLADGVVVGKLEAARRSAAGIKLGSSAPLTPSKASRRARYSGCEWIK